MAVRPRTESRCFRVSSAIDAADLVTHFDSSAALHRLAGGGELGLALAARLLDRMEVGLITVDIEPRNCRLGPVWRFCVTARSMTH